MSDTGLNSNLYYGTYAASQPNSNVELFAKYILILFFTVIVWKSCWDTLSDIQTYTPLDNQPIVRGLVGLLIGIGGLFLIFVVFKVSKDLEIGFL